MEHYSRDALRDRLQECRRRREEAMQVVTACDIEEKAIRALLEQDCTGEDHREIVRDANYDDDFDDSFFGRPEHSSPSAPHNPSRREQSVTQTTLVSAAMRAVNEHRKELREVDHLENVESERNRAEVQHLRDRRALAEGNYEEQTETVCAILDIQRKRTSSSITPIQPAPKRCRNIKTLGGLPDRNRMDRILPIVQLLVVFARDNLQWSNERIARDMEVKHTTSVSKLYGGKLTACFATSLEIYRKWAIKFQQKYAVADVDLADLE